jgi:arsenate reductase-like glutaredoxin family protein
VRSATREPVEGEDALEILEGVTDLYVAKGRRIVHHDLAARRPSDEELLDLMLGRSGKLRAPVLRSGSILIVGYNQDVLGEVLL